ncbi:WD40 repeat-like protein [Coniophora puteana RWD-64-598 SS2]|uniref:WD40 repeat-like protein n=1 Tax=Coniophora puteana (strain RWD-64-598) TaxID=741705 RepID=A0A5M3MJT6_CONPW|nr:WD40 repeat-like protein [Coniophora puteana RWD-64-598 SS2]EIW79316.1 WD40 repeat-like protein [Coniophora puteana RWD-64-598 SS2]
MDEDFKMQVIDVDESDSDIEYLGENTDKNQKRPRSPADASVSTFPNNRRPTGPAQPYSDTAGPSVRAYAKRKEDAIVVDSDSDDIVPLSKKQRLSVSSFPARDVHHSSESADEEEWATCLAALDIDEPANWRSIPERRLKAISGMILDEPEDDEVLSPCRLPFWASHHGSPGPSSVIIEQMKTTGFEWDKGKSIRARQTPHSTRANKTKIWDMLQSDLARPPVHVKRRTFSILGAVSGRIPTRELYYDLGFFVTKRKTTSCYRIARTITKIVQSGPTAVACATADAGTPDQPESEGVIDYRYNTECGSALAVWQQGQLSRMDDQERNHWRFKTEGQNLVAMKWYTVNDVVFRPRRPSEFLSAGNDPSIILWKASNDGLRPMKQIKTTGVPLGLSFKPGDSVLAVGMDDASISLYNSLGAKVTNVDRQFGVTHTAKCRCLECKGHATGAMAWGINSSSDMLFASSEPYNDAFRHGWHRGWNIRTKDMIKFNVGEAGDDLVVDPSGTTVVLITRGHNDSHPLRMFDLRAKSRDEPHTMFELRPFESKDADNKDAEVRHTCYSPDELYLAIARSDNTTDVYDKRMLGRGPLHILRHGHGPSKAEKYGVQRVHWLTGRDGRRTGLLTGGDDGCVRLWDLGLAMDDHGQGRILAQMDGGIANFSAGDPCNGEIRLIVGDNDGRVHMYDDFEDDIF